MKTDWIVRAVGEVLRILAVAILALGLASAPVTAQEPNEVGLVVQFGDGSVDTQCIPIEGDQIGGDELLAHSSLDVLIDPSGGMGVTVCRIEDQGCNFPAEHCFCQCMGGSDCAYWNYFYREPGADSWTYSALGASLRKASPGAVEAWVWGDGTSPPAQDITFESICGATSPTPTPEPDVETATATPSMTPAASATALLPTAAVQATNTAIPTPETTSVTQPAQNTSTPQPTEVPPSEGGTGLADYWPFGLVVVALGGVGVLVWLRQGRP